MDALRAGHVAILGGRFVYYCNQECKAAHLKAVANSIVGDDVATAEPPPVSFKREATQTIAPRGGLGGSESESESESDPESESESESDPESESESESESDPESESAPESDPESDPKLASGSVALSESVAVRVVDARGDAGAASRSRNGETIAVAGAIAGALAALVGVAGVDDARLPLAGIAMAAVVARGVLGQRDPADVSALVTVVPACGLLVAAMWTRWANDTHAGLLASLVGIAAMSILLSDLVVMRARRAVEAARDKIAEQLDVKARVVRGEEPEEIAASALKPGERVVVEAGEIVGADGLVVAGEAEVVPWLGAPTEVTKREGDTIVAGARVVSGALRLNVTWAAHERAWAKLALSPALRVDVTAPLARIARLVSGRGAPIAGALAGAAAYANNGTPADVIATACAAALACGAAGVAAIVGLAHAEGHVQALAHGIVFKDAGGFDRAGRAAVAVVCSRGTVLMGEPEIVALEALGAIDEGRLIALAAGAETASTHPFAAAILRGARARGEPPENVRNATVHAGLGVTALAANGERLCVGSRALLLQEKVSVAVADARVSELEAQGRSVLLVALAGKLVGLLALQDGLRPGARAAVQRLLDARIEPVLLSGEARETCETIGRALDIEHVRPEVLPADRGAEVRALGEGGHVVAVLGHPPSDDGALGAADVAIAMGAAGSTPGEWTVQLASDDVRDAALALSLAHATRDKARLALIAGLVPSALAILAIGFGLAPLVVAPIAGVIGTLIAARARS